MGQPGKTIQHHFPLTNRNKKLYFGSMGNFYPINGNIGKRNTK